MSWSYWYSRWDGEVAHRIVIVACLVALSVGYGYQPLQRVVLVAGGVAVGVGYGGYLPAFCVGKDTGVAQGAGYFLHLAQGVVVVGGCIAQGVGGAGYSPVPVVLPAVPVPFGVNHTDPVAHLVVFCLPSCSVGVDEK